MRVKPILFISPLPPPHGGIATWTQKIVQYGLPAGHPYNLIDSRLRGNRRIFDDTPLLSVTEFWRNLKISFSLAYHLIFKRPRLIHVNSAISTVGVFRDLMCVSFAKFLRIPAIVQYHGNLPDFNQRRFLGLSGKALNKLIRKADINIVTNQNSYAALLARADEVDVAKPHEHKITFLPNFIEDYFFAENVSRNLTAQIRAIFVGGITRAKGCAELFACAKHLPDISFHIFGKMHDDMADEPLPANVTLLGEVPHQTLIKQLPNYHFLIFPSYTEGFPLTVLEAMTFGLPVVATKVGAIPQMIDEGKGGLLCEPRQTEGLIAAVKQLLADPKQMEVMGAYNRHKSFLTYRYSKVIKDLMQLYDTIGS